MSALKIDLLQKAKLRIETGHSCYICYALETLRASLPWDDPAWNAVDDLRIFVEDALSEEHDTLGSWIMWRYDHDLSWDQMTLCRMAWIDKMIHDLEHP